MADKNIIWKYLSYADVLCQLAEEAAELGQAALKCRRAYGFSNNATPVSCQEAYENLLEEAADVMLSLHVLGLDEGDPAVRIQKVMDAKLERWGTRLQKNGTGPKKERGEGWISVTERMPQWFEQVLLHMPNEEQPVAEGYWGPNDKWNCYGLEGKNLEVTHWMPMPQPPESHI